MPRPPMRTPSDDDFTELVHAVWPGLYRTAFLMLGDRAEAEDLVQTALANTYGHWRKIRSLEAAPAFARKAMMNVAASWFRKRGWRNERPTESLPETPYDPDGSTRPTLLAALAELPPRQRAVIVLRYYEDLDVAATAAALGCSTGTVKSQTSDALARLRTLLGDAVIPEGATHD